MLVGTCLRCSGSRAAAKIMAVDREVFSKVVQVHALRVPSKKCQRAVSLFSDCILNRSKVRPVQKDGDQSSRLVLLDSPASGISQSVRDLAKKEGFGIELFDLAVDYTHFSAEEVLKQILPEGVEPPNSFELVGHIAHLNLKDEHEGFKEVIGEVIMDKNPAVKTVVNKVGMIESEYRVFEMEVLAGEPDFETEVREHGLRFKLDYSKVYWNSRLEHEHHRLVSLFKGGDVVCDMMAGIGPFAVPAGKKGCTVHANDLNPESFRYLKENILLNKVQRSVHPYNLDGREFVKLLVSKEEEQSRTLDLAEGVKLPPRMNHIIMNLPASAVEFLDVFNGLFCTDEWEGNLPWVHCYTFVAGKEICEADIVQTCEKYLGGSLGSEVQIHRVRDVAPNKLMVCVSFRLIESVALRRVVGGKSKSTHDSKVDSQDNNGLDHDMLAKKTKSDGCSS